MGILAATASPGLAQSSPEADAHNDAGKALFKERRYLEAYRRFKQAVAISPEGRFYFNVCFSLNYLERFQEAIEACEQVEPNGADAALLKKTNAVLTALRAKVPATPADPTPVDPNTGTGTPPDGTPPPFDPNAVDPNAVDPNTGNPIVAAPTDPNAATQTPPTNTSTGPAEIPGLDPFAIPKPEGDYAWGLGATLSPLGNLGVGAGMDGAAPTYSGVGFGLNMFANFMYRAEQRIGLQAYVGIASLPPDDSISFDALTIFDLGGAVYKHIAITDKIDLTPLLGVHLSLMQPDSNSDEALLGVGLRLQSSVDWYFAPSSKEHVLSFAPGVNVYSPAASSNVLDAEDFGLDAGGATLEFGITYQYRFSSAFGSGPLFTLE
jgi:tetratricopeptide (TPR) repeat protein